jgi:threonine/homoserine/homoserine lactone efflux protein
LILSGAAAQRLATNGDHQIRGWTVFRQGILTNVLNPKVALFFLAFLPQFIEVGSSTKVLAFFILGLTFIFNGTLWCLFVVWFSSGFSRRLRQRSSAATCLKRAAGALFVGLGVKIALEKT